MILIDTHIWIWLVQGSSRIDPHQARIANAAALGLCGFSCWEVAKLVERGRLALPHPVQQWVELALQYPGLVLLPLTPRILVASTELPGPLHPDPADRIIVATAREHDLPLLTEDSALIAYPHIKHA